MNVYCTLLLRMYACIRIRSTRPVPLSMNELTAEYWNSYAINIL